MLNKEEYRKIIDLKILHKRLNKMYETLHKDVQTILENKFPDIISFDNGDIIGDIILKENIPEFAQENEDGTYLIYNQIGEDWGNGTIYIPLNENEYLEIYYST